MGRESGRKKHNRENLQNQRGLKRREDSVSSRLRCGSRLEMKTVPKQSS